nr:MAG TPA: Cytokine-induced anti-apoptosis inhibitor 1 [Caudoviricetes sp.]
MTNEFFVGVLWGLPFLGMPPFFCVKKRTDWS